MAPSGGLEGRSEIFVSYSHADRVWLDRLKDMLAPIVSSGAIRLWDDTTIKPGDRWLDEIKGALARARVAVLLVSPDFLKSPFIARQELPPLLEAANQEGVQIFWVPVRDSLVQKTKLSQFQAAWPPNKPLATLARAAREAALAKIAWAIVEAFGEQPPPDVPLEVSGPRQDTALLSRVSGLDDIELVTDLIAGRWSLSDVQTAIDGDPDRSFEMIKTAATRHATLWGRLVAAYAASLAPPDIGRLADLALDHRLSWGAQFFVMGLVRFTAAPDRKEAVGHLSDRSVWAHSGWDRQRLAIRGLGFLGATSAISMICDYYDARNDAYSAEKLGPGAILAYVHCYLADRDETMRRQVFIYLRSAYAATEKLGQLNLHLLDYADELQCLRPGTAVGMFEFFREQGWPVPLTATLTALSRRPNPLLLEQLLELGEASEDQLVAAAAHHAAAYIGTEAAVEGLAERRSASVPGAHAAFVLAVGCQRDGTRLDELLAVLKHTPRRASWLDDEWHNALWALGELARDDERLVAELERHTSSNDAYARGLAWLGLGKAGYGADAAKVDLAIDVSTDFFERTLVATGAALTGHDTLGSALQGTIENHSPVYRMLAHVERDVRSAFVARGASDLCTLLDLGDFT